MSEPRTKYVTLGGKNAVIADPNKYPLRELREPANSWRFVVGPGWGSGNVLMFRSDLSQKPFDKGGPVELVFDDNGKQLKLPKVWVHSAFRVNEGGAPDDPDAVYVVRLVDFRYFLCRWRTAVRSINVRNWAGGDPDRYYLTETVKAKKTPYKWNEAIKLLWNDCRGLGVFRNIPAIDKLPAPEDLHNPGGNPWLFMNMALERIGFTTNYDHAKDKFSIERLSIDASPLDSEVAENLIFDARPYSSPAVVGPNIIRVYFAKRYEDYGTEADTAPANNFATTDAFTWVDVPTGIAGALPVTTQPLWASTPAVVKHNTKDVILNQKELEATAKQMADAWLFTNGGEKLSRAHLLLSGLHEKYLPNATIRETIVRDFGDGLITEIRKYPGLPTLPTTELTAGVAGELEPDENFRPIDLGRKTLPNYPRLPNIVEVYDPKQAAGAMIQPNNGSLHPGYVRRWKNGLLERQERCWISLVDDYSTKRGFVSAKNGDMLGPGRLSGLIEYGGERLPLYVVRSAASTNIIQFRLKEDLATGGSAEARQIVWNAAAGKYDELPQKIFVVDWYKFDGDRGMWQAPAGVAVVSSGSSVPTEGIAMLRSNRTISAGSLTETVPEYEIIWMETLAWNIGGALKANWTEAAHANAAAAGTAASVSFSFNQGKFPGSEVYVHDELKLFPRALKGAKFHAVRSEHETKQAYYVLTACQQACITAKATLAAALCGETATITGFTATSPSPFNQAPDPLPTTIANPRLHRGLSGDEVWIAWNHADGRYEIIDITRHVRAFPVEMEYDTTSKTFRVRYLETAAEVCTTDDPAWTNIFTAAPCSTP